MKKRILKLVITAAVLAALSLTCVGVCSSLAGRLQSQREAERWAGEGKTAYAQLSCFMSASDKLTLDDVYSFRQKLDTKLTELSLKAEKDAKLYDDAWSASGKLSVKGTQGSSDAHVVAVGGDFFAFHPLTLLSGGYLTPDDVMDDRVVLDRELAWKLFGGYDLAGMTVTISGKSFLVAGVVEREDDFATKKAYTYDPGIYMSYTAFNAIGETAISCYEIVMPQEVSGFAEGIVKDNFKIGDGEILNNTDRCSAKNIFKSIKAFGTSVMRTTSVVYPYWENAARCVGEWCALLCALAVLFAVFPVGFAFVMLMIYLIKLKDFLEKNVPRWTSDAVDRSRRKKYERLHGSGAGK